MPVSTSMPSSAPSAPMRAAAVQEGPAIADPAPAEVTIDGAPGHGAAQHLDGGAQVVPLALAGEDHGRRAPCLGHPAHRRVALRRHPRGRKPTTAWQLTLDHEHRALLGAVVEHLLGDDPGGEVAERLRHHALAGLLAPGDHAVAGHEVGPGLDRRIGCCGRRLRPRSPASSRAAPPARDRACGRRPASAG